MLRTVTASLGAFLSKNRHNFSSRDLGKILENRRIFMRTGLTKKQKVTEVYFNEHDDIAEIYTHNTELKKRLAAYAEKYPKGLLCFPHRTFGTFAPGAAGDRPPEPCIKQDSGEQDSPRGAVLC